MEFQCRQRIVRTFDLGHEQLQIIEEAGQQIRVLFRGIWLRDDPGADGPYRTRAAYYNGASTALRSHNLENESD